MTRNPGTLLFSLRNNDGENRSVPLPTCHARNPGVPRMAMKERDVSIASPQGRVPRAEPVGECGGGDTV